MDFDLLIRGGRIVDGSGMPSFLGDVGVRDGKVVAVGRVHGSAARTIDASGMVVAPGFIDHHTHLDAQMLWDPYGTSEPENGVTSVVMGNCGLSLAPVEDAVKDSIVKSFVRVEAMPRKALEVGVGWDWRSYGDYLDRLEGRVGINVGGLVGHIAVRHCVMGEEAVERPATEAEVGAMSALILESMRGGALGFSTNRNERHMREDGKPVASRLATFDELWSLGDVLAGLNAGIVESVATTKLEEIAWYDKMARRTGRPMIWQVVLHFWSQPDLWRKQLEAIAPTFRDGYRAYGLTNVMPIGNRFTMRNAQTFDEFPAWRNVMFLPEATRKQAFADPNTRTTLRRELEEAHNTVFHRRWDLIRVVDTVNPENRRFVGGTVADMAAARGQDGLDALLDVSLEEDLGTTFWTASGGDPEATAQILRSPYLLLGVSDAGAHVQFDAAFGYGTRLLGLWVREHPVFSIEEAIHALTFKVASIYEIEGRGLLRPGYAADAVIFDPETIEAAEPEWATDYPAGVSRLVQHSRGVHFTIVNGRVIYEDGRLTGDMAGAVLRGSAYEWTNRRT